MKYDERDIRDSFRSGLVNGMEAVENCEVLEDETLREAAYNAEQHARQYAGHMPTEAHYNELPYEAYEKGVELGISFAINQSNR